MSDQASLQIQAGPKLFNNMRSNNFQVDGLATIADLIVSGTATINYLVAGVTVTSTNVIFASLDVTGSTTLNTLNCTGQATLALLACPTATFLNLAWTLGVGSTASIGQEMIGSSTINNLYAATATFGTFYASAGNITAMNETIGILTVTNSASMLYANVQATLTAQNLFVNNFASFSATTTFAGYAIANALVSASTNQTLTTTIALSNASSQYQVFSNACTLVLPDATTLPSGMVYYLNNDSTGTVSVLNNSNTPLYSIPAGGFYEVFLLSKFSSSGAWDEHGSVPSNNQWGTAGILSTLTINQLYSNTATFGQMALYNGTYSTIITQTIGGNYKMTIPTQSGNDTFATLASTNNFTSNNSIAGQLSLLGGTNQLKIFPNGSGNYFIVYGANPTSQPIVYAQLADFGVSAYYLAGITGTIPTGGAPFISQGTSSQLSIPNFSDTAAVLGHAQTFTAIQTIGGASITTATVGYLNVTNTATMTNLYSTTATLNYISSTTATVANMSISTSASFSAPIVNTGQNVVEAYITANVANQSGDGTIVTFNGTNYTLTSNVQGSGWNATTGVYTIPKSGYYLYVISLTFQGLSSGLNNGYITLIGNQSRQSSFFPNSINRGDGFGSYSYSWLIKQSAGDTEYIGWGMNNAGSKTVGLWQSGEIGTSSVAIYQLC